MQRKYSEALIKRCQGVVLRRAGIEISEEDAEMCLDKLAVLGDLAVRALEIERKKNQETKPLCDR